MLMSLATRIEGHRRRCARPRSVERSIPAQWLVPVVGCVVAGARSLADPGSPGFEQHADMAIGPLVAGVGSRIPAS